MKSIILQQNGEIGGDGCWPPFNQVHSLQGVAQPRSADKLVKAPLCFSSPLWLISPGDLRSSTRVSRFSPSVCFLRKQSSLTGVTLQTSDQLPDQVVQSQPFKQGKFVFGRRKRILSQNKRWGANSFPCAVKQSVHSRLPKWHFIWVWCWTRRYPERFEDIYFVCCATLARYEGRGNPMSHRATTHSHAHKSAEGKHPEMKRQVVDLTGQNASGHVRLENCLKVARTSATLWGADFLFANNVLSTK